ncbi:MAG: ADP-forming succinate--CoA ligase subunit beta [Gammaproteobacteria bacterium]|nr:ADP-forming succinate--CoA ligase subunit beta [Gammaproteobacteria bacterium]
MNLHEYQSKELFRQYDIPVLAGRLARSAAEAEAAATELGGNSWVVKAQVHAGGRGKGGGIRKRDSAVEVATAAAEMIGTRLVTHQTGAEGQPIDSVLVECTTEIRRELYLALLVDRTLERVVVIASTEGGMDIEAVAAERPEKILKAAVDPAAGLQGFQCRRLGFALGFDAAQLKAFAAVLGGLYRLFVENDVSLVEINPLVVSGDGRLVALDAKINLDDNALFRHPRLAEMRDVAQEEPREALAREADLNYVALDGNIGCMVNGAGLAMATMDLVKLHGGEPANFLDVGGGTTAERVATAFKLIVADEKVRAILVNIFGGIVRCDLIAEGIIAAIREVGIAVPVVVRLEGTNVERGRQLLAESGLDIIAADGLDAAAARVVEAAGG